MLFARRRLAGLPRRDSGLGATGKRIHQTLADNPRIGLKVVAVLDDNPAHTPVSIPGLFAGPSPAAWKSPGSTKLATGLSVCPGLSRQELLDLVDRYGHCFGHISTIIPDLIGIASLGICVREVGGVIGLEVTRQLLRPSARFANGSWIWFWRLFLSL